MSAHATWTLLPAACAGSVGKRMASYAARSDDTRPVVLVVEDEHLIRLQAASMIEEAGYDVVEARNADEAIAILETRNDIQIVFTDVEMPGSMDGLRLAHAVRNRWPPIQLIVTSGRHYVGPADLPLRGQFVPKPYSFDELKNVMRMVAT